MLPYNDEWATLLRSYCVHGKGKDKYDNVRIGMNSRLDTLQAAVLLEKLKFFDEEVARCNQVAEEYTKRLRNFVKVPFVKDGMHSSWAQYTICFHNSSERERAIEILKEKGIPSAIYYRKPMHMQQAFSDYQFMELDYGVTESVCNCCLSVPMHAYLSISDIEYIGNVLKNRGETA